MSESDSSPHPSRRTAGLVLGGVAAGALLGAAAAAQPSPAAQSDPGSRSIKEQFRDAFAPGALDLDAKTQAIVVGER